MGKGQVFSFKNNLYLFGPINRVNANSFIRCLLTKDTPERIILSSEGGSVAEAIKICEAISFIPDIDIRVQGEACSAATFILASATGKREMTRNSYLMYHLPYCCDESLVRNSLGLRASLEELTFLEKLIKPILLNKNLDNKKVLDFYKKFTKNDKNFYLSAKEALEIGLIDKIV